MAIRLRVMIGRELENRSIEDQLRSVQPSGCRQLEATKLLTRHQWRKIMWRVFRPRRHGWEWMCRALPEQERHSVAFSGPRA